MSYDSDMAKVVRRAVEQGFRHHTTEKDHHQFYAPDGVTIVTTGGTPSPSSWNNFLSDLKRAGYVHEGLHTLGEAMPNGGAKLSASQYIVDLLARHPEGLSPADVGAYVRSVRPELNSNASAQACSQLVQRGKLIRSKEGNYLLAPIERPKTNGHAEPDAAPQFVDEEEAADADLKALDDALVALGVIESVVRRNRAVLQQLAALKKLLGGGK